MKNLRRLIGPVELNYLEWALSLCKKFQKNNLKVTKIAFLIPVSKAFIVNVEDDKKFKYGDILMPAGYNAPARNSARGNILDGAYAINWTGACYL